MTEPNKVIKDGYLNLEIFFTGEISVLIAKSLFRFWGVRELKCFA